MASHTRHTRPLLMTGAAVASAASLVAVTPTIVPTITAGAPAAVSGAQYTLTTVTDLFSVPLGEWINALYQGYGGAVDISNPNPANPSQAGGLDPWAQQCTDYGGCYISGVSAVAYLALDALINGNGTGYTPAPDGCLDNPSSCDGGYPTWDIGAVNYLFEGGFSAGAEYLAQSGFGQANPALSALITLAFAGPALVTYAWTNGLALVAGVISAVPLVGPVIAGGINAYLGADGYTPGISGILQYVRDLVTGGLPSIGASSASAAAALAAGPRAVGSVINRAVSTLGVTVPALGSALPKPSASRLSAVRPAATVDPSAESGSPEVSAADAVSESTDAVGESTDATTPAEAPKTPAKRRPLRNAVERVTKSLTSALSGATANAATSASTPASGDAS